jgi:O-antigen/teichoic acid export membrane protein
MTSDSEPILEIEIGSPPIMERPAGKPEAIKAPGAKLSLAFLVGSLAGGNVISSFLRMIGGILQARFVLPSVLGLYNGIGLVLGYVPFLQIGVLNGMNRELPYYIGKGDRQRAWELAAAAQAWALAISAVVDLVLFGIAGWQLVRGELWLAAGWATNAVLTLFLFYNTYYLRMTYRTAHDFAKLALVNVVENAVALALVVLVALLNFYGMCLRALLAGAVSTAILYYWRPVRVGPIWNFRHLKHLLIIGAPIFGVGQIYSWWSVFDSTMVLGYLGDEGMGLYALVVVAVTTLEQLPLSLGQVVYPRMAEQYGRKENIRDLIRIAKKPIIITVAGMVPIIGFCWLVVDPVVRIILPKYLGAVPAIKWSLLIPFVSSFAPINNVFNVVRRQVMYFTAIIIGMVAYICSLMWLIRGGPTLIAFPQAMIIGKVVFMLICYGFIVYLRNRERANTAIGK